MSSNDCNKIKEMLKELKPIVEKVPMDQNKFKEFITKYNLGNSETMLNNIGICSSVAVNISDNIATIPNFCVPRVERKCRLDEEKGYNYQECFKKYRPSMKNVTQINDVTVDQQCNIKSLLKDDSVQKNTQLALLLKLLLGKSDISCEQGVANSLSFISEDLKSIDVLNNCLNESFVLQRNNIDLCYADGIYQKNVANVIQECSIESKVQSGTPVHIGNDSDSDSDSDGYRNDNKPSKKVNRIIKFDPSNFKEEETTSNNNNNNYIIAIVVIILLLLFSSSSLFMLM
jgi:hypothetical protein